MTAPAIIYLTLCVVVLFGTVLIHDKPQENKKYNFWHTLIRVILLTALLWWGGFFNTPFTNQ